jgi:hypothetical protein
MLSSRVPTETRRRPGLDLSPRFWATSDRDIDWSSEASPTASTSTASMRRELDDCIYRRLSGVSGVVTNRMLVH